MNYRHAYHAGNFADVLKHTVLSLLLAHLRGKPTPFCVVDCHAGTGCYDLSAAEAGKTGEFRDGIARLLDADPRPAGLDDYLAVLKRLNADGPALRFYPGSPLIAREMLRPNDRLLLSELHPEDAKALKRLFAGDHQVVVHREDAYAALKALLPPAERRGLVLIDPPFEAPDEFRRLLRGLGPALRRWPTGIYVIWYPIKDRRAVDPFLAELALLERPALIAELYRFPPDNAERLNGCGLAILNPPWRLDPTLETLLPDLARALGATGGTTVRWVTPPSPAGPAGRPASFPGSAGSRE